MAKTTKIRWSPKPGDRAVLGNVIKPLTEDECAAINAGRRGGRYPTRMRVMPTAQMDPRHIPPNSEGVMEVIFFDDGVWRSTCAGGSLPNVAKVTRYLNTYWGPGNWEYAAESVED